MQIGLYSAVNGCMAYVTDVAGKCHGYHWQMPRISLANATDIAGKCRELSCQCYGQKNNRSHTGEARGKRLSYES